MSGSQTSLSFNIDSSQAQRAISVLDTLRATSIQITQSTNQFNASQSALTQTYGQQADALSKLATATKTYDGTLAGLIGRLTATRTAMASSLPDMARYAQIMQQATAAAVTFGGTIDSLDRYVAKTRELRQTTADLATGFQNISTALRNQNTDATQLRQTLALLGVTMAGIPQNRADLVQQAIADRLRTTTLTRENIAGFQQVLGPSADAQTLTALGSQPYQTMHERRVAERQAATAAQIDTQMQAAQRITSQEAYNEARRVDLANKYKSTNPFAETANAQRERLEGYEKLSPEKQAQYQRPMYQLTHFLNDNPATREVRHLTDGTFGSNDTEIQARYERERAQNGFFSAFMNAKGRDIANAFNLYTPTLKQDPGQLTELDRRALRRGSAGVLASYGDQSLTQEITASDALENFRNDDTLLNRYRTSFGDDGIRRHTNQMTTLTKDALYSKQPEREALDNLQREQMIMALPPEQRESMRDQLAFIKGVAGPAAAIMPTGTSLAAAMDAPTINEAQREAGKALSTGSTDLRIKAGNDETKEQIDFQKQLADSLRNGRAAAEDFTRAYASYHQELMKSGDADKAMSQGLNALNVALAQRVVAGRAGIEQMRQENDVRERQINQARNLATESPMVRRAAELAMGIDEAQHQAQLNGSLPSLNGGSFTVVGPDGKSRTVTASSTEAPAILAEDRAQRQQQIALPAIQGAQGAATGAMDAVRDARAVADAMESQGLSAQKAAEALKTEQQFAELLAAAAQSTSAAAEKEVASRRDITVEMQRQAALEQARASNIQSTQSSAQRTTGNQLLASVPPEQRAAVEAFLPRLLDTLTANQTGTIRLDPAQSARAHGLMERLQRDKGLTREGAAAVAGSALDESGVLPINEQNPTVPGSRGGTAFWQYTGEGAGRRGEFEAWAKAHNLDPKSEEASVRFFEEDIDKHPAILDKLRTPGLSAANLSGVFLPYTAGGDVRLLSQAPKRAATATALAAPPDTPGAGQRSGSVDLQMQRAVAAVLSGQVPDVAGLPPDVAKSLLDNAQQLVGEIHSRQQLGATQTETQGIGRRMQLDQQRALSGQRGLQARVAPIDLTKSPDVRAREGAVYSGTVAAEQHLEQGNAEAATNTEISNNERIREAATKSTGALALLTEQIKAEQDARDRALSPMEKEARARQLITASLTEESAGISKTMLSMRDTLLNQQTAIDAAAKGTLALRDADAEAAIATQRRRLETEKLIVTDVARKKQIDEMLKSLDAEQKGIHQINVNDDKRSAESEVRRQKQRIDTQNSQTALGPFATNEDLRNAAMDAELRHKFQEDPDLENSTQGQAMKAANAASKASAEAADRMNELRSATREAEAAFGSAFTAMATGVAKPQDALRSLVTSLEQIAIKALIIEPGTRMLNGLLGDLFGSGASSGSSGGSGSGGGGSGGGLLSSLFGGSGSGSGSNNSSGGGGGGGAGVSGGGAGGLSAIAGKAASAAGSIFSRPGGLLGAGMDKVFGEGFYAHGGLLGSMFGSGGANGGFYNGSSAVSVTNNPIGLSMATSALPDGVMGPVLPASDFSHTVGIANADGPFSGLGDYFGGFFANGGTFPRGARGLANHENEIVYKPTVFRFANGGSFGMMGEAGSPEAVMPLRRGADGRLGVAMHGGGGGGGPAVVNHWNITTSDANSFRSSQPQLQARAAATMSRSVQRNQV